ncbi:DUF736 domain-containing protein [Brucella pituitosa]|uniref:DUF736 domain-containing protein n=1 Tax=Brucella pituitosa TaxID=571256 RepID=UPI0009A2284E|nr:DUF736 family protein [Brucella pituitosa]
MPVIGTISPSADGRYEGYLRTLFIDAPIVLIPTPKLCHEAADFRILSNGAAIGSAWIRVNAATASNDILLVIEAPELPRPIHAVFSLARHKAQQACFDIIWLPRSIRRSPHIKI